jgi:hypothetical protein
MDANIIGACLACLQTLRFRPDDAVELAAS